MVLQDRQRSTGRMLTNHSARFLEVMSTMSGFMITMWTLATGGLHGAQGIACATLGAWCLAAHNRVRKSALNASLALHGPAWWRALALWAFRAPRQSSESQLCFAAFMCLGWKNIYKGEVHDDIFP